MVTKFVRSAGSPLFVPAAQSEPTPSAPDKRVVVVNGRAVGEITRTGDDLKDAEAAEALLRAKGHKPPTLLDRMYMVAISFSGTARDLYKAHLTAKPANGLAAVAFVVNAAFSIEVYLKLLHAAASLPKKKKHDLLVLYDALPQAVKDEIEGLANQHAKHHRIATPINFRALVADLNTAFARWRYVYEYSSLGAVTIQPTMLVMHVLHDIASSRLREAQGANAGEFHK